MMTDRVIDQALSILPNAMHVLLETNGHDLGLDTWTVGLVLRAVTVF